LNGFDNVRYTVIGGGEIAGSLNFSMKNSDRIYLLKRILLKRVFGAGDAKRDMSKSRWFTYANMPDKWKISALRYAKYAITKMNIGSITRT